MFTREYILFSLNVMYKVPYGLCCIVKAYTCMHDKGPKSANERV